MIQAFVKQTIVACMCQWADMEELFIIAVLGYISIPHVLGAGLVAPGHNLNRPGCIGKLENLLVTPRKNTNSTADGAEWPTLGPLVQANCILDG
jgi:hypothetical protein